MDTSDVDILAILPEYEYTHYDYLGNIIYTYPDSNNGGNWKSTNPKAEQSAMDEKNKLSYGLLKDTCKHIRAIRDEHFSSYHLSGILIDSFVYSAMDGWRWTAPGSNQIISTDDYDVLEKILKYMVG